MIGGAIAPELNERKNASAIAAEFDEAEEIVHTDLVPELEGLIRSHLPISSCIKFASVCKEWYSHISSRTFTEEISLSKSGKRPFLFLWGVQPSSPQSLSCMYDPIAGRWFCVNPNTPYPPIKSQHYGFASGECGPLVFYPIGLSSPPTFNVHYVLNPMSIDWRPVSPTPSALGRFPVVGVFDSGTLSLPSFKVFILSNASTIHLYDSAVNTWECCNAMPQGGYIGPQGAFNLCSTVMGRKIYIVGMSSGMIVSFDVDTKKWSGLRDLRILSDLYMLIASSNKGLFAVAICLSQKGKCLNLFTVNEATMECELVSTMPQELWTSFEAHPEVHLTRLRCVGSGNLLYVYFGSHFNDIRICVCDVEDYSWRRLPDLPSPLQECEGRVECCSIRLLPMACLNLEKWKQTKL